MGRWTFLRSTGKKGKNIRYQKWGRGCDPLPFSFFSSICRADEADLFTSDVSPDALIILDLSGSMLWVPCEQFMYMAPTNTPHVAVLAEAMVHLDATKGAVP